jgi:signal transduction histidine kinase
MPSPAVTAQASVKPFSLSRWFGTVGLLSIVVLTVACALLLSRLFADRMLLQEGRLTMQFVQSIIDVEVGASYFAEAAIPESNYMEKLLLHIAGSPDVLRTNLYSRNRRILWSSDATLIGRSFANAPNAELDAALGGQLEVHEEADEDEGEGDSKLEHANLRPQDDYYIEIYVPVWDPARQEVVGAVELYRAPRLLRETIVAGMRIIWAGAIGAGVLLYLALLPLVRRAERMIRMQQERLVESETLAAVGDLGAAVAHGIRNPLAVIRSSAELMRDGNDNDGVREAASDIMTQVDRLEHWVRELLTYVHLPKGGVESVELEALIRDNLVYFSGEMRRRGIDAVVDFSKDLPPVRGDSLLLAQVANSVIANALEAMQHGGKFTVTGKSGSAGVVVLQIKDTGVGMTDEQLRRAFKPFHTTKSQGLGVGLPLAKRIVERMGGKISLSSEAGAGTIVDITLLAAGRS